MTRKFICDIDGEEHESRADVRQVQFQVEGHETITLHLCAQHVSRDEGLAEAKYKQTWAAIRNRL